MTAIDYSQYGAVDKPEIDYAQYGAVPDDESLLGKAGNMAGKFNEAIEGAHIPSVAGGILQEGLNMGTSLANVPVELAGAAAGKDWRIPTPNLEKYLPDTTGSKVGFGGGELIGALSAIPGAAEKIGSMGLETFLSKLGGLGKAASAPTAGALAGAALGENQEGSGRELGAATGAAANTALSLAKFAKGLFPESMANSIVAAKNMAKQKYSDMYNNLFKAASDAGLKDMSVKAPPIDYDLLKNNSTRKFYQSLDNFKKEPTLENAHWAQSDLGKLADKLERSERNNPLTSEQYKVLNEARDAQQKIRAGMGDYLHENGQTQLADAYNGATQGYAKDVVPYTRSKAITDYENGKIKPETFAKRIEKDDAFRMQMGDSHPEIATREKLRSLVNNRLARWGTSGIAAGMGIKEGADYMGNNQ